MVKRILFALIFFLVFPQSVFAVIANFQVTGVVQTSDSKVMPGSTVVFLDKSGKEIVSSTAGPDGRYQAMVPEGEYTVTVKAPADSKMGDIKFSGQLVHSNTSRDFTFNTGKTTTPIVAQHQVQVKKANFRSMLPFVLIVLLMIIVLYVIFRNMRKRKPENEKTL